MRGLHRLACATAGLTFLLLLVGGIVHGTGSSLACPDWPLCFGEVFPAMRGGVLFEHSHRLFAATIGLLTVAIATLAWKTPLRRLGALALALVIVQGVLGGLTVIYRLPTLVSTAHLGVSMLFFLTLATLAWRSRPAPRPGHAPPPVRTAVAATVALVFLQIVLGGLVRHTGAGLACLQEVPLCFGRVVSGLPSMSQLHMLHRLVGLAVGLLVVGIAVAAWPRARLLAGLAPVLVAAQLVLGIVSVSSSLGLWQVTAHLGGAALLLVDLWLLRLALQ